MEEGWGQGQEGGVGASQKGRKGGGGCLGMSWAEGRDSMGNSTAEWVVSRVGAGGREECTCDNQSREWTGQSSSGKQHWASGVISDSFLFGHVMKSYSFSYFSRCTGLPSKMTANFDSLFSPSFLWKKTTKKKLTVYFPFLSCENNQVKSRAWTSWAHWLALDHPNQHYSCSFHDQNTKQRPTPTLHSTWQPPLLEQEQNYHLSQHSEVHLTVSTTRQEMTSLVSLFHLAASTAGIGMQNKLPPLSVQNRDAK